MIDRILEFSVRQRVLVLMAALALLIGGVWSAIKLPMDAIPDITGVQVQVNTTTSSLAPEEVENLVTFPLETALGGIAGVTEMRSLSRFGLSQIILQFTDDTDIYRARQLVTERLQSVADSLPPGLTPKLAPITTGLGEVFYYTVDYAPGVTNAPPTREAQLMELWQVQEYIIKPQLRTVPGIAEINAYGGYVKQIVVQPRLDKLRDAGLTVGELARVVSENVENAGGGIVNSGFEQLVIRGVGRVTSPEEIAELPVKFAGGVTPLRVKDVAEVQTGHAFRTGAATDNGAEAVIGVAMMLIGENSRAVSERVARKVEDIQKRLPPGIIIKPQYKRSELVDRTIHTVEKNLFEGAMLVVVMLLLLLGNWRAALVVATAIPLSFLFAITGMARFGISGNLMSLGAIDFGLIIDGTVVIVENVVRRLGLKQHQLGRPLTREERLHTVLAASKQVGSPMFFGVLIITIVYLPILALAGIEGKMFRPMALTVMLALGGALVLALTLMPALCSLVLRGRILEGDNRLIRFCKRLYLPTLHAALRLRWFVVFGAVAPFALAIFIFTRLGADFIPVLDEGAFTMMVYRTTSISVDATVAAQTMTDREIQARVPEVERVFSRIGSAEIATDPMPPSDADFYIFYKPRAEWRKVDGRPITKAEFAKVITKELETLNPGAYVMVAQPIEMRFNEMLEGIRADIAVKIFGNDYDVLERLGAEVKEVLEKIPGTREAEGEVEFETMGRTPMLEIKIKRDVLAKYNLQAGDVNQVIAAALGGHTAGALIEGNRRFDIVVRLAEKDRESLDAIRALPVRVGESGMLALGELADIQRVSTVSPIMRDSGQRRSALLVNLEDRDVESWVREAEAKVREQVKFPAGYTVEFGGQFENLLEAKARLAIVVPAALLFIFVLIFMAFGSVRQAVLVYTGIPLAATGGVFALWLRGMPFSITAAVGFIALSGVAVLNGVVLVSYFNHLREEGKDVLAAVTEGSLTRLRPVLMTAAVAAFGFLPMALATGPGAEVQRPLATVVIGGVLSSTFLTLVLLPVLYEWVEGKTRGNVSKGSL
ncbi:MAG TPA: CusA/CzcA family heavy metal efflux RND transporter [Candidatus Binatia bacterium]|jgi:cobalt-zinc-cadmium resistance protein CzcA|nr:CusA/CzcA family heavy metal efflux RND transporter [Candidatus Binatia bacterium]